MTTPPIPAAEREKLIVAIARATGEYSDLRAWLDDYPLAAAALAAMEEHMPCKEFNATSIPRDTRPTPPPPGEIGEEAARLADQCFRGVPENSARLNVKDALHTALAALARERARAEKAEAVVARLRNPPEGMLRAMTPAFEDAPGHRADWNRAALAAALACAEQTPPAEPCRHSWATHPVAKDVQVCTECGEQRKTPPAEKPTQSVTISRDDAEQAEKALNAACVAAGYREDEAATRFYARAAKPIRDALEAPPAEKPTPSIGREEEDWIGWRIRTDKRLDAIEAAKGKP